MSSLTVKQRFALALFWMIVALAVFTADTEAVVALLTKLRRGESLATTTKEADPHNHNYITYQYTVNEETFIDVGYGPDQKEIRVGDQVAVRYFPPYPELATIHSDTEQSDAMKDGVVRGIFVATAAAFLLYWKKFRQSP